MKIEGFGNLPKITGLPTPASKATGTSGAGKTFFDAVQDAVGRVNAKQVEADDIFQKVLSGEETSMVKAMVKSEDAQMSFQFALQVRNKVVNAYQEIMRMQI